MTRTLLVANRGEIAVRVLHAAADLGLRTVAVYSSDDAAALHVRRADHAIALPGAGPAAYLDADALIAAARESGADLLHPGYGFLSESAPFAERVAAAGVTFVGPAPSALITFGDKARARALAGDLGIPLLRGSARAVGLDEAQAFWREIAAQPGSDAPALVVKAVAGGGGRGMRVVERAEDLAAAFARCRSEAAAAFGDDRLYVEEFLPRARHVEVQLVGDGSGAVLALGDRDCTLQRRHQKLVEIAPAPGLDAALRARLAAEAVRLGEAVSLTSLCTIEFLIGGAGEVHAFLEANPRVQVEHTITEEVLGLDLVRLQIEIAGGASLARLGLSRETLPRPHGHAVQLRVNAETMGRDGLARPAGGTLTELELPAGQGLRVDTAAFIGAHLGASFDSLLAKIVVHSRSSEVSGALARARRALEQTRIAGVATNLGFLRNLLAHPEVARGAVHTRWVEAHLDELVAADEVAGGTAQATSAAGTAAGRAGAQLGSNDPLAVLAYGKSPGPPPSSGSSGGAKPAARWPEAADGTEPGIVVRALLQGTVIEVHVAVGDLVHAGQVLAVMSAMKMEHEITAPGAGRVLHLGVSPGDTVVEAHPLLVLEPREDGGRVQIAAATTDPDTIRPDLAEVLRRQALLLDDARPEAVAKRRRTGQRTARENVAQLCDPGSFSEYGGFAIAAQRQRRALDDLIASTPADGMITGVARVNGELVGEERARCAVLAYDYTVLAGTQGFRNHQKKDRLFELAERLRLPVVIFTEGGGGRPGDTDAPGVSGLDCMAFHLFGRLSGLVPLVGVVSGRCFAGNAALLGCCDVVIATAGSNIGMGGPAMIEGGGLGVFRPEEVGPLAVQVANGVVDVAVRDEAEAVDVARRYLSYFQGPIAPWSCADQRRLRSIVPENRLRIYEIREVIETLADEGSVLELRRGFGAGMVTALARFAGRPVGIVANDPRHLAGAIDAPAADKAARFLQLCDAFDLPVLFLCDTPGIMVGPEAEKTALVRHCSRLFVVGASLTVPFFTIVLRKSYGLGAQAMGGGSHRAPLFTVAWPTGEFGGMGLEGAVKLGFRKELAAVEDPVERQKLFAHMVERAYEHGKALNVATHLEIDDVIDPADSRDRVIAALRAAPPPPPRQGKKRPCVDTW